MKYLLDTHAFLWSLFEVAKLSDAVQHILADRRNEVYVSVVTYWEISLKYAIGKLELEGIAPDKLPQKAEISDFFVLDILPEDAASFYRLPRLTHKDPFDRLLIWQAINHDLSLISQDSEFKAYEQHGLKSLW